MLTTGADYTTLNYRPSASKDILITGHLRRGKHGGWLVDDFLHFDRNLITSARKIKEVISPVCACVCIGGGVGWVPCQCVRVFVCLYITQIT